MDQQYKYAIIKDSVVENIIQANYFNANSYASSVDSIAVQVEYYPVQIGDIYQYDEKTFSREGIVILRTLTPDEKLAEQEEILDNVILDSLNTANDLLSLTDAIDNLVLAQLGG